MFSKIRKIVFSTSVLFFSTLMQVFAQTNSVGTSGSGSNGVGTLGGGSGFTNPLNSESVIEFLTKIIDILLIFALPIIIFFIMYGGFLLVTAQGEPEELNKGKSAITWAVIGGVIALGANVIVDVIKNTVDTL